MFASSDQVRGSLGFSDPVSETIEDLQYTLGEGPCVDAHNSGIAVEEPDLAAPVLFRWHAFTPPALKAGARAVFGFPIRVGAVRLGALNLYRNQPGSLTEGQLADAQIMAEVAGRTILAMQAGAPPGEVALELEEGANFQYVVHRAAGMMSIQLDSSIGDALVRLRAYAFRSDRLIADVARDVVARRLRFDGDE
jgi:GAF domain-containing protein